MGLEALASLATVVSAALGSASLLFQVLPFLQMKGEYEALRAALKNITSPQDGPIGLIYDERELHKVVAWLDRGAVLMTMVRRRVIRRSIIAACGILILAMTIPFDAQGLLAIGAKANSVRWFDVFTIVVVTIGPKLAFLKGWLLSEPEKKFLMNFRDLEESFYRREVAPKIDVFNAVFESEFIHVQGAAREELTQVNQQIKELSARVDALLQGKDKLPSGPVSQTPIPG